MLEAVEDLQLLQCFYYMYFTGLYAQLADVWLGRQREANPVLLSVKQEVCGTAEFNLCACHV